MADVHEHWLQSKPPRPSMVSHNRRRRGKRRVLARITVISGLLTLCALVFIGSKSAGQHVVSRTKDMAAVTVTHGLPASASVTKSLPASAVANGRLDTATCRMAAVQLAPELMETLPGNYLETYQKTPCWGIADGVPRCLPGMLLAGGFQSGAGTLAAKLTMHPEVYTGPSSSSQFWAEFAKPVGEYLDGFSEAAKALKPAESVIMDYSQSTSHFYWSAAARVHPGFRTTMESCWRNCSESAGGEEGRRDTCVSDTCFAAAQAADRKVIGDGGVAFEEAHLPLLLHAAYGDWPLKVVVLLRNPVDRLHSAFWAHSHYRDRHGATAEGFTAYVTEQLDAFEACASKHGAADCALYFEALGMPEEKVFFHCDQIIRGMHSVFLERWLRHVPRERLLAIKAEDYFNDGEEAVRRVLAFLGLPAPDDVVATMLEAGQPHSATNDAPAMLPGARDRLLQFYRTWNEQLSQLLEEPRYLEWNSYS